MPTQNRLEENPLFGQLPLELSENLRSINPWWRSEPSLPLPSFQRWPFKRLKHLLERGMAPATVLRGPRRVGKTVLIKQIIETLLHSGIGAQRILYVPFDELPTLSGIKEPVLTIARWFEKAILGSTFNAVAKAGESAYLFMDEVQNLDSWAPQIKNLADNHAVRILVTGSSSLRIEAGRDSLAGRITTIDLGPLLLREIAELRFKESVAPYWGENNLDALTSPDFWRSANVRGAQDSEIRRRSFSAFRKEAPTRSRMKDSIRHGQRSLTISTRQSSSEPFNTISEWARGAKNATNNCLKRSFACAAGTPDNHRDRAFLFRKFSKCSLATSAGIVSLTICGS